MNSLFFSDVSPVNHWTSIIGLAFLGISVVFLKVSERKKNRKYFVFATFFFVLFAAFDLYAACYLSKTFDSKIIFWLVLLLFAVIFFVTAVFKKTIYFD